MQVTGKRILVVGMARSGIAVAKLLCKAGATPILNDSKEEASFGQALDELRSLPCQWRLGRPAMELLDEAEGVVISPGIPDTAPFVVKAREMGLEVIGELEMAFELSRGITVAVTGTNGKTTTVSLLGEMFKNAGKVAHVVGNIGYPYSAAGLESHDEDVMVTEVSSFQLETIVKFHPRAAALLNITEDHLNRHGTMAEYNRMKMRIFENQTENDCAVFNDDDPLSAPLASQVKSQVWRFSRTHAVPQGAFAQEGKMIVRFGGEEKYLCDTTEVRIPGPHNLENALAAVCIAVFMGVPAPVIRHTLRTFAGVEHRIEFVRELDGVRYINDSKGTNVDSTLKAIETMTAPTVIILGGYDKHCDFTPLAQAMKKSPQMKAAVLLGATADQIETALRKADFTAIYRAQSLQQAVDMGRELSQAGGNVLLSPACASFDMFSDYEARGRIFKEIVRSLQ